MENNNSSSNSSVCTKIRHVFASNPALQAIQRISSINQEHKQIPNGSNYPSSNPKTSIVQTKPHHKSQTETSSEPIHIKFDYSTPTYKEKGHSSAVSTVGNSEHVPKKAVTHNGNQQGKESVDINDTFKEFIQRAKKKIRTMSTIGRGQNNPTAEPDHEIHHGTTTAGKNESHEDHFQDFIHRVGKKIRATTMRRN
ncbi:unnamed protein product [Lathyrus oleraceus]|uniref:Uncharacterized protein n=1 Tax=Pisum sativum TaxID=3888 RepID=A0A9D4WCQ9_PEA|nr:uncharacterized protein LOC127090970 [Pisum sativum]KAI5399312.1 hypothetical protein KIW84_064610 [Pisum sativum]